MRSSRTADEFLTSCGVRHSLPELWSEEDEQEMQKSVEHCKSRQKSVEHCKSSWLIAPHSVAYFLSKETNSGVETSVAPDTRDRAQWLDCGGPMAHEREPSRRTEETGVHAAPGSPG
eukprot:4031686-Pleurochrysis_carterae.AAC.1